MKLIVGLGNPGERYQETRHNAGRLLVQAIARQHKLSFSRKKKLQASIVPFEWDGVPVILAFPETFMNLSGEPVRKLVESFGVAFRKDLLVVTDDYALPFGKLRLRGRGSDGGHNGLRSIHQALGSLDYPRLRLGIGKEAPLDESTAEVLEDYVLSTFTLSEKRGMESFLRRGIEACRLWVVSTTEQAMNAVNAGWKNG